MKIDEVKSRDIVPRFMEEDITVKGFCAAMDYFMKKICEKIPLVNLYQNLHLLDEADLDYIAKKDNIKWYDTSYEKEQKIRIIQNHEKNCMFLGTKESIEGIINDIFGMGEEEEWFEYGAEAYKFRIITSAILTEDNDDLLRKILKNVKTSKSILDYVRTQRDVSFTMLFGCASYGIQRAADITEYKRGKE